jgi:hypothetical protein
LNGADAQRPSAIAATHLQERQLGDVEKLLAGGSFELDAARPGWDGRSLSAFPFWTEDRASSRLLVP